MRRRCVQIRETIPATMADYVRNSYGKQAVTDDPFDYVQQTVCTALSAVTNSRQGKA